MVENDPIKVLRFDLYRPVREVRIGSIGYRYADRPLLGSTVEIGRWRLISTVGGRLREKEEEGEEDVGERGDASSPRAVTDNNVNKVIDEILMFVQVRGIANSKDSVLIQGLYTDAGVFVAIPRCDRNSAPWSIRTFSSIWKGYVSRRLKYAISSAHC
ncbi:hypothetical protein BHM03_00028751 [Ensete ventricosum]|nr:hypothetical protein BHM03_00028751 [Ensete ventricosum]